MYKAIFKISLFVLLFLSLTSCNSNKQELPPNIIVFLADDLGYNELGCYGQEYIKTPNIDKLATQGMIFDQFYSGSPVCAPSRCALLTGKHPGHMYIRNNDEWDDRGDIWNYEACNAQPYLEGQRPMPDSTQTLAHMLQDKAYKTACIGKWGLGGPETKSDPNDMGFDLFYGYNCQRQAHTYFPVHLWKNQQKVILKNPSIAPHSNLAEGADPNSQESYRDFKLNDYAPDLMLDEAINFLRENQDEAIFMFYASPLPHVALQAPQSWVNYYRDKLGEEEPYTGDHWYFPCQYPRATYAAMISYLDWQLGEVMKELNDLGLSENTLVIFTSDNGPTYAGGADTEFFKSAFPFSEQRGRAKGSLYEGGIRVPMIASWPGVIPPGSRSNYLGAFWDFMPTFLEVANAPLAEETDGISFVETLKGVDQKQDKHDFLYWEFGNEQAIRHKQWKAIRTDAKSAQGEVLLFDLDQDINEQVDVAAQNPAVISQIKEMMKISHDPPEDDWRQKWVLYQ